MPVSLRKNSRVMTEGKASPPMKKDSLVMTEAKASEPMKMNSLVTEASRSDKKVTLIWARVIIVATIISLTFTFVMNFGLLDSKDDSFYDQFKDELYREDNVSNDTRVNHLNVKTSSISADDLKDYEMSLEDTDEEAAARRKLFEFDWGSVWADFEKKHGKTIRPEDEVEGGNDEYQYSFLGTKAWYHATPADYDYPFVCKCDSGDLQRFKTKSFGGRAKEGMRRSEVNCVKGPALAHNPANTPAPTNFFNWAAQGIMELAGNTAPPPDTSPAFCDPKYSIGIEASSIVCWAVMIVSFLLYIFY